MVIMWDVDGVLANFTHGYHSLANEMFDANISLEQPPTWDWLEDTIGSEKVGRIWNRIKQDPNFWRNLPSLVDDSIWDRIVKLDADQYFVTSRVGETAKLQTEDWLFGRMWQFDPDLCPITVVMSSRKADAANALKANYTIDDKLGNVLAVYYNSPPERRVYVYDTPYNQMDTRIAGNRVRRVSTVSQFLDDIEANR